MRQAAMPKVSVHPRGKVTRAIGHHHIVRQTAIDRCHHRMHVDVTGQSLGLQVVQIVCMRSPCPFAPDHIGRGAKHLQRSGCGVHGRQHGQIGLIDAIELLGTGVDMNQLLSRTRRLQQGVAAGGHFPQTRADGQHEIGILDALSQPRVDADAHIAGV